MFEVFQAVFKCALLSKGITLFRMTKIKTEVCEWYMFLLALFVQQSRLPRV